jgi:hypothetical protein
LPGPLELEAWAEHRFAPLAMVEIEIPGEQILVDVGEVHVSSSDEVRVSESGVAERLEVRDLRRSERGSHSRRESEEQLCRRRHQLRALHLRGRRDLIRKAFRSAESTSDDTCAETREGENVGQVAGQSLLRLVDQVEVVASQQDRDVVVLENRFGGVAGEAPSVLEYANRTRTRRCAPVDRKLPPSLTGHEPPEVRQAPRDGDGEAEGRRGAEGVELGEDIVERTASVPHRPLRWIDFQSRGNDSMVKGRNEHLDALVPYDLRVRKEVLLTWVFPDRSQ